MTTYLVTGGAGFIGSNLVHALVKRGERVRVLDNFSTGKRRNLARVLNNIELMEGDLRNYEMVKKAVQGVDYILHQGALPSVPRSIKDPLATHEVNITGTLNLLIVAKKEKVKRLIYASSSSIYGDSPELPKHEGMSPEPKSPYAVSKLAGEYYCRVFWEAYGLETVCLRYFNIFGPRQDPASLYAAVIPKFINAMLKGTPPTIYGDGLQSRDFTYIENVVEANLLALQAKGVEGQVFNIACGGRYSVMDLVKELNRITRRDLPPRFSPPRKGDVRHSQASIVKAEAILGYSPKVGFQEGLQRTVEWMGRRAETRDLRVET